MKIEMELHDLNNIMKKFPQAGPIINRLGRRTMAASLSHFEEQVSGETPVNFGTLRAGWATDMFGAPVAAVFEGKVVNPTLYGEVVEVGRKPGTWPPRGPIELWVIRKLGIPAGEESRSVAFLIARKIGTKGTDGAFMMKRGFENGLPKVKKLWNALPDAIIRALGAK